MIKGGLTFYGTVGDGTATLEVDRTYPVDLAPFFKELFYRFNEGIAWRNARVERKASRPDSYYQDKHQALLGKNYELTDKLGTFTFKMDDFYSMTLLKYTPQELGKFLEDNMKDPTDFGNEAMLKRLAKFEEDYARIYFHYTESVYFLVEPMDKIVKPSDIEDMITPTELKQSSFYAQHEFEDQNRKGIITTKPYHCQYEKHLEKTLRNRVKEKKIIRVYHAPTPPLNLFKIIVDYNLPTEHLDIVLKNSN